VTGAFSSLQLAVHGRTAPVTAFVCLPLVLTIATVARAGITRTPADLVVGAFAVPCLLTTTRTLSGYVWTRPVFPLCPLVSPGAGLPSSVVLLTDGVVTRLTGLEGA
jgi:hypothetical protein